jgi:hypothetical protein
MGRFKAKEGSATSRTDCMDAIVRMAGGALFPVDPSPAHGTISAMKKVFHVSASFAEAEQWDIRQHREMPPDDRLDAVEFLRVGNGDRRFVSSSLPTTAAEAAEELPAEAGTLTGEMGMPPRSLERGGPPPHLSRSCPSCVPGGGPPDSRRISLHGYGGQVRVRDFTAH